MPFTINSYLGYHAPTALGMVFTKKRGFCNLPLMTILEYQIERLCFILRYSISEHPYSYNLSNQKCTTISARALNICKMAMFGRCGTASGNVHE